MRKIRFITMTSLLIFIMILTFGCNENVKNHADVSSSDSNELQSEACFMPIYFDSEEQLLSTINEVKSKKGADDNTVTIFSKTTNEQKYSAKSDEFKLVSLSEFYKPKKILKDTSLGEILVKNEYVAYVYYNKEQIVCAAFTWYREMSPEVHMNELYGRGEISAREINYNGIKYVLREWPDPDTNQPAGYTIDWVAEGKSYGASIPLGYTDDEMLEFCQFETVHVK